MPLSGTHCCREAELLFFSLWDIELGERITSGLQDPGPDGLAENNQFVTDLISLPPSEIQSCIFHTWHGQVPSEEEYSCMLKIFLYHFLISSDLSAIASHFYILPPSLEVKNKVPIKDEGEVLLEKRNKRDLLLPAFLFFNWFSEPTPIFSSLSYASSVEICPHSSL